MEADQQAQLAFHLTGRRADKGLEAIDGLGLCPALLARYRDLNGLRYDYPLVLLDSAHPSECVQSLTYIMDSAVQKAAQPGTGDRVAKHAGRIERAIRTLAGDGADLHAAFEKAAAKCAKKDDDLFRGSVARLRDALPAGGKLVQCGVDTPAIVFRHVWRVVHTGKGKAFQHDLDRLALKLSHILVADDLKSDQGRSPQALQSAMGGSHVTGIDFAKLSNLIERTARDIRLPVSRRKRIEGLLKTIKAQKFLGSAGSSNGSGAYSFEYQDCRSAVKAYVDRLPKAIELSKAIAMAELEIEGEYREEWHDPIFASFGANGLDPKDSSRFPDYFVSICGDAQSAEDMSQIAEVLAAGLPMKILVQTDDLLAETKLAEGHLSFGLKARQLANMAMAQADVFVLQSSVSHLYRIRDRMIRGLSAQSPAIFSLYSGAGNGEGALPLYLAAASAMESRAFPAFVYDPSAGHDWASRFFLADNPQPDSDWPVHAMEYEGQDVERQSDDMAFTLLDFVAADARYARHFARVPREKWTELMAPLPDCLDADSKGIPDRVPYIWAVDRDDRMHRVIVDEPMLREARRCREMWRSLQELGGFHNSHAERLIAREREALEAKARELVASQVAAPASTETPAAPTPEIAAAVVEAPAEAAPPSDDPYIETPRCTTCNECTNVNNLMFAYNENKQAYVKDPDAGTYRQLVEAAEGCQVGIIHPGKPRNPNEPGLEELLKRAEPFL